MANKVVLTTQESDLPDNVYRSFLYTKFSTRLRRTHLVDEVYETIWDRLDL